MGNLSKLKKVDLREIFKHEAYDFTQWLSQPENLELLSNEIGIDIQLIQTEANVGDFNVDILAQEEGTNRKIIIENQLEDTNHDHLGKIITYAAGYDAEIIIWIVKKFREEHKKAIEWLNEHTDENINFFLIVIELWKIDDSAPAPKFNLIVSPNEWAKIIKNATASGKLTDTKIQQLDFWEKFKNFVYDIDKQIHLQTPSPRQTYDVHIGNSDAHIALKINSTENKLSCELYINKNKDLYKFLKEYRNEIENELGEKAEWNDAKVASIIKIVKKVDDVFNEKEYDNYFNWLYEKTVLFKKVFTKYINEYKNK
jgi:hypothetical protein